MSGLFQGSQMNWAGLTKEAYVNIYVNQKTGILFGRCRHHSKK